MDSQLFLKAETLFGVFFNCRLCILVIFQCFVGNSTSYIKDAPGKNITIGLINSSVNKKVVDPKGSFFADDIQFILDNFLSPQLAAIGKECYSFGVAKTMAETNKNNALPRKWTNPLEIQLPKAPSMTIYNLYGIGKETERGYIYKSVSDVEGEDSGLKMTVDIEAEAHHHFGTSKGIYFVEGDGTVPLVSLGYMGVKGWRKYKHLNPAGVKSVVREYKHDISLLSVTDVRGGPKSGDHVDILGNHELTMDILRIVTNTSEPGCLPGHILGDRILSNIMEITESMNIDNSS